MNLDFFVNVAFAALAILVAVLAVYWTIRLMGKVAKGLTITVAVVAALVVVWFVLGELELVPAISNFL